MKKKISILMMTIVAFAGRADITNSYSLSPNLSIPDGNPVGLVSTLNVGGALGTITYLTVNLNITAGFNGDLYAYLVSPSAGSVMLLNRVGLSSSNSVGYSENGFNVSFTADASNGNFHFYDLVGGYQTLLTNGLGFWQPDQRLVDPIYSSPGAYDAAPTGNNLDSFYGSDPNGDWTLFVADVVGGGQSTLVSWGLTVVTVPEPQTWTLLGGGLVGFYLLVRKRHNRG